MIYIIQSNLLYTMEVFIKRYGWVKVLEQSGNYSLCLFPSGANICFNTLGFEFRKVETQLKIEL